MGVFEAIMLICFGAAWPASIYRSIRSKSTKGKSLSFLFIIMTGYIAGICNKSFFPVEGEGYLVYLYILNLCMVAVDTALYIRNRRYEKATLEKNIKEDN